MTRQDVERILEQRCEMDDLVGNPWPHDDPDLRLLAWDAIGRYDLPGWTLREIAATQYLGLAENKADYMAGYWLAEWSGVHNFAKERYKKIAVQQKQKEDRDAANKTYDDIYGPASSYRAKTYENFVVSGEAKKKQVADIRDWPYKYQSADNDEPICWSNDTTYYLNLILAGPPGTGKTHLACALYHELRGDTFHGAEFIRAQALVRKFKDKDQKESLLLKRYGDGSIDDKNKMDRGCELLVIDDVGVDKSDNAMKIIIEIIDLRNAAGLFTVITTNLPKPELAAMFGDRGAYRLFHRCLSIGMPGDDFRAKLPSGSPPDGKFLT